MSTLLLSTTSLIVAKFAFIDCYKLLVTILVYMWASAVAFVQRFLMSW